MSILLFVAAGWVGGAGNAIDVAAIRWLAEMRADAPSLTVAAVNLTQAGSAIATIGAAVLAAAYLYFRGSRRAAAFLAFTSLGERLLVDGIKLAVARPRPSLDAYPLVTHSSSFPSGHAANSMAVFLALALWLAPPHWRRPSLCVAVFASLIVGATRPLLGVHWASDVVAGWLLGASFVAVAWCMWTRGEVAQA